MKIQYILFLFLSFCLSLETIGHSPISTTPATSEKNLILYLSRTQNTKTVAQMIQEEVGGDLVALELETPYPENYQEIVSQVAKENETGFLPPLKTKVNLEQYETIFLGFPTWGMKLPPPMKSFLKSNDLEGKTVLPFNTNAGYGVGSSFEQVRQLCENCNVKEGYTTKGGIERDGILLAIKDERKHLVQNEVRDWLKQNGF
ncbi:flavodoxin [Euzebyella marina]|uniref:Flavodoxin n=1 Tax=Euzebyella marina TaxID=1761453 RepID=A0A3G2L590_9FLAO|nr:flavodoxin [Euzebyella marina]AYN67413.1 flavodoxin [Euzebyella marina]